MWSAILAMGFFTLASSVAFFSSTEENYQDPYYSTDIYSDPENVTCPEGSFPCQGTTMCLKRDYYCDGDIHCPNGDDEGDQTCLDTAGSIKFIPGVHANNMTFLDKKPDSFYNCTLPTTRSLKKLQCFCRTLHDPSLSNISYKLVCDNNTGIIHLPEIPPGYADVVFIRSSISDIVPGSLSAYGTWNSLTLNQNKVKVLRKGAFRGLVKLKNLFLERNQIHVVEHGALQTMTNLNWLFLDHNQLKHFDTRELRDTPKLLFLSLQNNRISFQKEEKVYLPSTLSWLFLGGNQLRWVKSTMFDENSSSLVFLNLSHNLIEEVDEYAFKHMRVLKELSLHHNQISYLKPNTFYGLSNLDKLNLGYNLFTSLPVDVFSQLHSLISLSLLDIEFSNINIKHFDQMRKVEHIRFKKFRYCSYAPHVRICQPKMDGVSSTEHLLVWPILRLSVWVVALVTIISNVVVFAWRILSRKEDRVLSLFVKNLSVADFLMGIYLLSVAVQDVIYRDVYNRYAMTWMTSWRCLLCGVLAMLSCEVSVLILSLITFERYRCIRTNVRVVTEKAAKFALLAVWLTGLLLALLPLFQMDGLHSFYANNGLCFPLHIHDPYMVGWQYSAFVFLGVNFFAVVLIISLYLWMFVKIKHDRRRARPVLLKQREDAVLARRFFFIVLTDCLCWIPIIIIKILALSGIPINDNLYAMVVVFVLPVNSALNPVIYTLAAPTELRRRIRQLVPGKWFCKTRHSFASTDSKTANSSLATQSSSLNDGRSNSNGTVIIPAMAIVRGSIIDSSNEESDVGDETKL